LVDSTTVCAEETPSGGLEAPAILPVCLDKMPAVPLGDRLRRGRTDICRVIADVVIARDVTAGKRKRGVQRSGKFKVIGIGWAIESEIAGVDDQIGPLRVD